MEKNETFTYKYSAKENEEAESIRRKYLPKEESKLETLKRLDAAVSRPANIFAFVFGSISAIIMGAGMSLIMTEIGEIIGMNAPLVPGIIIGIVGMIMALVNYPIYNSIIKQRRAKYSERILALSESICK
ncbi:MAG: dihydropteridine reductase [Clostridia bacterium]|nr:dihydropteridine reductase [Clostridia bacterium]